MISQADKRRARRAVQSARKDGRLVRPHTCQCVDQNCPVHAGKSCNRGDFTGHRLEGHHADHSKPLEVVFLCNPCHKLADDRVQLTASVISQIRSYRSQGLSLLYIAVRLGISVRSVRKAVSVMDARTYIDLIGGQHATTEQATG